MRGLAYRHRQQARARSRARRFLRGFYEPGWVNPRVIGRQAATRVPCSCWMCGNPRRYFGERTRQEVLVAEGLPGALAELGATSVREVVGTLRELSGLQHGLARRRKRTSEVGR